MEKNIFSTIDLGQALKQRGITLSERNANIQHENWSDRAFAFLCEFIKINPRFRAEEAREYAMTQGLEEPKSNRAFGAIMLRAAKAGLVKKVGHEAVSNIKAHRCYASVWERKDK